MEFFECQPLLSHLCISAVFVINRLCIFRADIGDAEEFRLSPSTADREVQCPVFSDGAVGQWQWRTRHEFFLRCRIRRT